MEPFFWLTQMETVLSLAGMNRFWKTDQPILHLKTKQKRKYNLINQKSSD
jgi:hypothetical protein